MQFDEIKHRRVTIKPAKNRKEIKSAFDEYNRQLQVYQIMRNDKIVIKRQAIYLSIYSESNKMIGIIQLELSNDKVGRAEISIPNPEWCMRYGTEALHQFVRSCKNKLEILTLKEENTIVTRYKRERTEILLKDNSINFVKV